jgi:uncharacterized protein (TIGR02996 family)
MDDSFAQLRQYLSEEPTLAVWEGLSGLFEAWESDTPMDVALSYGVTHMKTWADEQPEPLLASLLAFWQLAPSAALADVIDQVSARVTEARGPVPGNNRKEREAAWRAICDEEDSMDVARLVQALPTFLRSVAETLLNGWQEQESFLVSDPRFTKPFLELLSHPPNGYQGWGSRSFWLYGILKILEASRDPRLIAPLFELDEHYSTTHSNTSINSIVRGRLADVARGIEMEGAIAGPSIGQEALFRAYLGDLLPEIEAPEVQDELGALYEAVYTDPASDEPRLALAAFLEEKGDPRGAFIRIQCKIAAKEKVSKEERKQVTALRKEHQREWLGALEPVVHSAGLKYERGFPSALRIGSNQTHLEEAVIGLEEWSPVVSLDMKPGGYYSSQGTFFEQTTLRSLREVKNGHEEIFTCSVPQPIEVLHILYRSHSLASFMPFANDPSSLPALRDLEIHWLDYEPDEIASLWETPLMQQLEAFAYTPNYDNRKIVKELPRLASTSLQRLKLKQDSNQPWSKTAIRQEDGFTKMIFQCEWSYEMSDAYDDLCKHHLAKMRKNNILTDIEIRLHKKNRRPTQEQVDKVEGYLAAFKNLERYELVRP